MNKPHDREHFMTIAVNEEKTMLFVLLHGPFAAVGQILFKWNTRPSESRATLIVLRASTPLMVEPSRFRTTKCEWIRTARVLRLPIGHPLASDRRR